MQTILPYIGALAAVGGLASAIWAVRTEDFATRWRYAAMFNAAGLLAFAVNNLIH